MELKIYIRKTQLFDLFGNSIIAVGTMPNNVVMQPGTLPNNNWQDITGDVDNLDNLSITITTTRDANGAEVETPGVSFSKKAATGQILISGASQRFIRDWIYNSPTTIYNSIDVRIEDVGCGIYDDFVIKRSAVTFCEDGICQLSVTLSQRDQVYDCIQKTVVSDNWQGWFQEHPVGGKKHPRFSYCVEPNSPTIMVISWYLTLSMILSSGALIFITGTLFNTVFTILRAVDSILRALGGNGINVPPNITVAKTSDSVANVIMESAGCGREHPAPLIRDYIQNVCTKCNVDVDATTFPLFFSKTLNMTTGANGAGNYENLYYNATWLHPSIKRGIRRFSDFLSIMTFDAPDTTSFFQQENGETLALSDFLDKLQKIFNSEWRIRYINGRATLFFLRKDWYYNGNYIYNFSEGSADREKIIQGICFNPMEIKYPASVDGIYGTDAAEEANVSVKDAYNGKAYNFGQLTDNNPNFSGILTEPSDYIAATRFGQDGSEHDYIYDTFQIVLNGIIFSYAILGLAALNPLWMVQLSTIVISMSDFIKKYVNYAIYFKMDTAQMARIIIWDGKDYLNARAIRTKRGFPTNDSNLPDPTPFSLYNTQGFNALHPRNTKTRGLGLTYGHSPPGVFQVKEYLGTVYLNTPCELSNYPMYFNPGFQETLWDNWWFIEDPRFRQNMGLQWTVSISNCCEDKNILGVFSASPNLHIGDLVKLPTPFIFDGVIREIKIDYSVKKGLGRLITLKGTV